MGNSVKLKHQPYTIIFCFYSSIYPNSDPSAAPAAQAAVFDTAAASDTAERSSTALRGCHHSSSPSASCSHSACPASSGSAVPYASAAQSACYLPSSFHLPFYHCESAGPCPEWTATHAEPQQSSTSTAYRS